MTVPGPRVTVVLLACLAIVLIPSRGTAQRLRMERLTAGDGTRLDFPTDGVWRARARQVARTRAALRTGGPQGMARMLAGGGVLSGTLYVPTVLLAFSDTDTGPLPGATTYESVFFTATPLVGRPYTLRTFYEEMSNDLLSVQGSVYDWVPLSVSQSYVLDACPGGNALDCGAGLTRMWEAFTDAVSQLDGSVDFGAFDNDGPDGVPNTNDDDGVVDVIQFVQPVLGGECGGPGIWAHKYSLSAIDPGFPGQPYTTDDAAAGGGMITIDAYYVVSGVGGPDCVQNNNQAPGIGLSAHELGHGLGLPDLYDALADGSAGIGEWGLMGSGMYTTLGSPAHLSAWSKEQLGWVTLRELTATQTYTVGPVVTGDTVFLIRPDGANQRGEYFLLENKQAVGADTANIETGGGAGPKDGGLLVWHIDSLKIAESSFSNSVNSGAIHGVTLLQADGLGQLETDANRGDAGDPYPGATANTRLSYNTTPGLFKHSDGDFAGFEIAAVRQLAPDGEMSLEVNRGVIVPAVAFTAMTPPPAVMGAAYSYRLEAEGGLGTYSFTVVNGALPQGLTLDVDGTISGIAEETGDFPVDVRASSGSQSTDASIELAVLAPPLVAEDIVRQLVGTASTLTAEERRYLDLLGNRNDGVDVGDFLAWLDAAQPANLAALADLVAPLREERP